MKYINKIYSISISREDSQNDYTQSPKTVLTINSPIDINVEYQTGEIRGGLGNIVLWMKTIEIQDLFAPNTHVMIDADIVYEDDTIHRIVFPLFETFEI